MTRYRAVYCKIWNHRPFVSDDTMLVMFHLLTSPSSNKIGLFRSSMGMLSAEMEWETQRYVNAFNSLPEGFVEYDLETRYIFIPGFIQHNPPNNPNVLKGWSREFDEVPSCELKNKWFESTKEFSKKMGPSFLSAFEKAFSICEKAFPVLKKGFSSPSNKPKHTVDSKTRKRILKRDGKVCINCGESGLADYEYHIDHIIPTSKGGTDNEKNLQVLCYICNSRKGASLPSQKAFRHTEKAFRHHNHNHNHNHNTTHGGEYSKSKIDIVKEQDVSQDIEQQVSVGQVDENIKGEVSPIVSLLCELWPDLDILEAEQYYLKILSGCPGIEPDILDPIIRKAWAKWPVGRSIYEGGGIGAWIIREIDMVNREKKIDAERKAISDARRANWDSPKGSKLNVNNALRRLEKDLIDGRRSDCSQILNMSKVQQTINEAVADEIPLPEVVVAWLDKGRKNGAFDLGPGRKIISFVRVSDTPIGLIKSPGNPMSPEETKKQVRKAIKSIESGSSVDFEESHSVSGESNIVTDIEGVDGDTMRLLEESRDRAKVRAAQVNPPNDEIETIGGILESAFSKDEDE